MKAETGEFIDILVSNRNNWMILFVWLDHSYIHWADVLLVYHLLTLVLFWADARINYRTKLQWNKMLAAWYEASCYDRYHYEEERQNSRFILNPKRTHTHSAVMPIILFPDLNLLVIIHGV